MCDRVFFVSAYHTRPAGIVYVNRVVVAAIDYKTLCNLVGTWKLNVYPSPQDEDVGGLPVSASSPCWRRPKCLLPAHSCVSDTVCFCASVELNFIMCFS